MSYSLYLSRDKSSCFAGLDWTRERCKVDHSRIAING